MNQEFIISEANRLLFEENFTAEETVPRLVAMGADPSFAHHVTEELVRQFRAHRKAQLKEQGKKDVLYGLMWLVGGTVLTVADTGYIFWGAIAVGGFQFLSGLVRMI